MRRLVRWVRHDEQKRPLRADGRGMASVADRRSWASYVEARRSSAGVGLGFMLGAGIGAVDLDDAISAGRLKPWARSVVDALRSVALAIEVSPSGRGVHVYLPLEAARGRRIRQGDVKIEVYSQARFMTVTGRQLLDPSSRTRDRVQNARRPHEQLLGRRLPAPSEGTRAVQHALSAVATNWVNDRRHAV